MNETGTETLSPSWHSMGVAEVERALGTSADDGLSADEAARRLARVGPNVLPTPPSPSVWAIALLQWRDPMNLLLTAVAAVSFIVGQPETAILVTALVVLNVVLGARQELKAKASVAALDTMQVPSARVRRDGAVEEIEATGLVPGDVISVEAGDVVPADARIASAASLEVTESALTGESAPVPKGADDLPAADAALGDRDTMLFQGTSVTRGAATAIVTGTGTSTEMGKIAGMLGSVQRAPSPLQVEIRALTVRLAIVCLVAVAFILIVGFWRGLDPSAVILLAIATAISSIPSGLPTFLTAMLSYGSQRLAKAHAVVKNLTDVEALGSVSAVNSDKTGTLTMDMMTATRMFDAGRWFEITGSGYSLDGRILHAAGQEDVDFTALGYGLTLCSDATVSSDGTVVGDPTEAALVVLAAKMGVDAPTSRREYPRAALVPFDSAYKFMATFHVAPLVDGGPDLLVQLVKGAPDVILDRCASAQWGDGEVPMDEARERILAANRELAEQGLRVMSFAYRAMPVEDVEQVRADPMAAVGDLVFVALVGIIDPLRPSAKEAVQVAQHAGIDVRMITGDHAVTAKAIAGDLGLGQGVITGPEFQRLSDAQLRARLPELHVFGRVAPEDKLRLVTVMQEQGQIVAMTGDAVNDAAALKKADIGVAMGSGSEVSKQAAKMVLLDDNFATLVHAIELGRDIYGKITGQIRYVMVGLFGVLLLMLLASAFNINSGNAMTAVQLIFVTFLIGLFPAIAISTDTVEPGIMDRRPRDPRTQILNRSTAPRWFVFGLVQAVVGLVPYLLIADDEASAVTQQSMVFAVMGLSTVLLAATLRRDLIPAWDGPYVPYFLWLLVPAVGTWLAVETDALQRMIGTTSLTDGQWLVVLGLSLIPAVLVEVEKAVRRMRRQRTTRA
ncbi:MAG: cation-translocating P-type ATPase [Candidatus Nanopelagicales bacterium]